MAAYTMQGTGNVYAIADALTNGIRQSAMTADVKYRVDRPLGSALLCALVFEKYYMRSSNYASLTVVLSADGEAVNADLMGSGGSSSLINFSWFAEDDFVGVATGILSQLGFSGPPRT